MGLLSELRKQRNQLQEQLQKPLKRPRWLRLTSPIGIVSLFSLAVGAFVLVVYFPQWQTAPLAEKIKGYETSLKADAKELATLEKGRLDSENAIRTAVVQGLGGIAVLIGIYFAYRNLKVAEDKQVTERFGKAVEMLSSGSMHMRLGGIYALERIAKDSDKDYWQVMEVLTAFVRAESPYPPKPQDTTAAGTTAERVPAPAVTPDPVEAPEPAAESESSQSAEPQSFIPEWWQARQALLAALPTLRTDIQAVMTVISRRKHRYGKGEWETQWLDLQQTDLRQLQAAKANLTGVRLSEAHLEGASLSEAHLEGASLRDAHLESADLIDAHLESADLIGAHLEGASLCGAHLESACLIGAHLEGADLTRAHLEGAQLWSTDLSQSLFLTQKQLDSAQTSEYTLLSLGLHLPTNHFRFPFSQPTAPPPTSAAPEPVPTAPSTSSDSTPESTVEPLTALMPEIQTEPKAESEGTSS